MAKKINIDIKAQLRFMAAKKAYRERLLTEQAMRELTGQARSLTVPRGGIKDLDFKQVYRRGIWRIRSGELTKITGAEAIAIQTQSMYRRANLAEQNRLYKKTYVDTLRSKGWGGEFAEWVENKFKGVNDNTFAWIVAGMRLPEIRELYVDDEDERERVRARIEQALTKPFKRGDLTRMRKALPQMRKNIREREKLFNLEDIGLL